MSLCDLFVDRNKEINKIRTGVIVVNYLIKHLEKDTERIRPENNTSIDNLTYLTVLSAFTGFHEHSYRENSEKIRTGELKISSRLAREYKDAFDAFSDQVELLVA